MVNKMSTDLSLWKAYNLTQDVRNSRLEKDRVLCEPSGRGPVSHKQEPRWVGKASWKSIN